MKTQLAVIAGLSLLCGAMGLARGEVTGYKRLDESWVEQHTPDTVAGMSFVRSQANPEQSYRMSDETYKMLNPFGIVSRIYIGDTQRYDAVVIAGDNADCFHDQRACFNAQGWTVIKDGVVDLDVRGVGNVPVNLVEVQGPNGPTYAIFAFRGPSGELTNSFDKLWNDFFSAELKTGRIQQGEFFRFIALDESADVEKLKDFAAEFMAEAVPLIDKGKQKTS